MGLMDDIFTKVGIHQSRGDGSVPQHLLEDDRRHSNLGGISVKSVPPGLQGEFLVVQGCI